jgi:hypothetical protein
MKDFKSASATLLAVFPLAAHAWTAAPLKRLLIALLAILASPAVFATVPALVGSNYAPDGAVAYTPTAGNDLVIQVIGLGGTPVLASLSDSVGGDTVLTDFAFAVNSALGIGVYRVHNVTAVSHTFTANWSTAPTTAYYVTVYEVSGISGVDTGAGTISINTGTSTSPVTESLTPSANNDFLLAAIAANHVETLGSWTNGFTQKSNYSGGPTFITSYLVQSTAASVSAGVGFNTSVTWTATLVAYSATGVCTDVGQAQNGTISVPNGTSGLYLSPTGTWVTPDCSAVAYWSPPASACASGAGGRPTYQGSGAILLPGSPYYGPTGQMVTPSCSVSPTPTPQGQSVVN